MFIAARSAPTGHPSTLAGTGAPPPSPPLPSGARAGAGPAGAGPATASMAATPTPTPTHAGAGGGRSVLGWKHGTGGKYCTECGLDSKYGTVQKRMAWA